jgi:hypothetical protein
MVHHPRKIAPLPSAGVKFQACRARAWIGFAASFRRQIELSDDPELAVTPEARDKINGNSCSYASRASGVPIVLRDLKFWSLS